MQKYIKKNIEISAVQYNGMPESLVELESLGLQYTINEDMTVTISNTTKGDIKGEIGDYVMMSVTGEFDICPQDKFKKLYSYQESNIIETKEDTTSNFSDKDFNQNIDKTNNKIKKQLILMIIVGILLLTIILLPFVFDVVVKKTIKTTVQYIYKEEIEKESKLLLDKTKLEAQLIIDQAKEDAKNEADESFRKEMERLTNERVRN